MKTIPNVEIIKDIAETRNEVYAWSKRNRVSFDSAKEHIGILHPIHGCGQPFKLLGCIFDCKLTMSEDVDRVLAVIRPKVKA